MTAKENNTVTTLEYNLHRHHDRSQETDHKHDEGRTTLGSVTRRGTRRHERLGRNRTSTHHPGEHEEKWEREFHGTILNLFKIYFFYQSISIHSWAT